MLTIQRILCPVDFSAASRGALAEAADLARRSRAELLVLHVIEPILYPVEYGMAPIPTFDLESSAAANLRGKLDELAAAAAAGVQVRTMLAHGRPEQTICEVAKDEKIDLIVLATHGLTGLKHMLLGSVAERVVRHAPCAVLTVKPAAA